MLIINADDWGADRFITGRIMECMERGMVNSTSAMLFMKASAEAAELACAKGFDTGLHLNFTEPLTASGLNENLLEKHNALLSYLRGKRLPQFVYNPFLQSRFEYVFKAQYEEYERLYGKPPGRVDGHHHMHLCANMLVGNFIPCGKRVRRSYTFARSEKNALNRAYRAMIDRYITRRYVCTRYFISIRQIWSKEENRRVAAIRSFADLSCAADLELLIHPYQPKDFECLTSKDFINGLARTPRCSFADLDTPGTIHAAQGPQGV